MLLSKYTRCQEDKHQSKHFGDHEPPQIKLQHQMKCRQLQTGTLIQYAGSSMLDWEVAVSVNSF